MACVKQDIFQLYVPISRKRYKINDDADDDDDDDDSLRPKLLPMNDLEPEFRAISQI